MECDPSVDHVCKDSELWDRLGCSDYPCSNHGTPGIPKVGHINLGSARTTHPSPLPALQNRIDPKHLVMTQHPPRVRTGYEETPLPALRD